MGTQQTPRNAQDAIAQANRFDRAKQLLKDGYQFCKDPDSEVVAVVKPGTTAAAYWLNMITDGCDCPDFLKNNQPCKHMMAWQILQEQEQAEQADDKAMWESICARHDADNMELPEPKPLTLVDVLEALQSRIVVELDKARTDFDNRAKLRTPETHERAIRHFHDLRGALNVINEYWNKEVCNRLDLQPAEQSDFDSGFESAKDLLDGRI